MARAIMINDNPVSLRQVVRNAPRGAGHGPKGDDRPFVKAAERPPADKVTPFPLLPLLAIVATPVLP